MRTRVMVGLVATVVVVAGVAVAVAGRPGSPPPSRVVATASPTTGTTPSPTSAAATAGGPTPVATRDAGGEGGEGSAPPAPSPPAASPTAAPAPLLETTVTIVSAAVAPSGDVEVGAFATALEDAGTCTLTATSGRTSRVVTSAAVPDATTTSCGYLAFPAGRLEPGPWDLVVTYTSATSHGTSAAARLDVR